MRKGFLVVSGCPRSGTSVCMDIQRAAHGDDAICGHKFPQEIRKQAREKHLDRQEWEAEHEWRVRNYQLRKQMEMEEAQMPEGEREFRDMNPEGFWEMAFTVRGVIYRPQFKDLLGEILKGKFRVIKVVSQGLLASDPQYLGRIIYMIRHPRAVAKSQERLVRGFNYIDDEGHRRNAFEDLVVHTPEMFTTVTTQAARFLLLHPTIPVRFYHFEDLVRDPDSTLKDMQRFVGVGDYAAASDVVQPRLNRSVHENVESDLWDDAEFVYDRFREAARVMNQCWGEHHASVSSARREAKPHLDAIVEYMSDPRRNTNREKRNWFCPRARMRVNEAMCRECIKGGQVAVNFRKNSERTPVPGDAVGNWTEEPCLFECGYDLDRQDYLTIEESVERNFWLELNEGGTDDAVDGTAG